MPSPPTTALSPARSTAHSPDELPSHGEPGRPPGPPLSLRCPVGGRHSAVGGRQSAVGSRQSAVGSRGHARRVLTGKGRQDRPGPVVGVGPAGGSGSS
ncbi:hypothetical protein BM536_017540 [Streptomyces phaeoluteigriseus]|uniref:Uncharacterized protein n=1 Tax=Streptomyces phaeoluteigriseus TaxID=114686 RepID=A0A1V6MS72_9ACTN|nr:hypothetical protein BM536_017540 [Streptomyces phaeoluteigriseus]